MRITKAQQKKVCEMLDKAKENYRYWKERDDYPDKPCVRRATATSQNAAFNLADYLCRYGFISWEVCCQYWNEIDIYDAEENEACSFDKCGANENGICKYTKREGCQ